MIRLTNIAGLRYQAPRNALLQQGGMGSEAPSLGDLPNALAPRRPPPDAPSPPPVGAAASPVIPPASGPASIRTNNPGAMWPGPSATRFGATEWQPVAGGNRIAVFSDPVSGAAAHFDLLGRGYANMTLSDAVQRWSGGNSNDAYVAAISRATGMQPNALLTPEMLRNPAQAIPLARAMAQWEAGRAYPLTDEQWQAAHTMAFQGN